MDTPIDPSDAERAGRPREERIPHPTRKNAWWECGAYALLIVLTMIRVGSTWRVFSQTTDEPIHFLSGYEWLPEEKSKLVPDPPPLARVLAAFPLWLAGARDGHEPDFGERI